MKPLDAPLDGFFFIPVYSPHCSSACHPTLPKAPSQGLCGWAQRDTFMTISDGHDTLGRIGAQTKGNLSSPETPESKIL